MHNLRKVLALLLVLSALLSALPLSVWAAEDVTQAPTQQEELSTETEGAGEDPTEPETVAEAQTPDESVTEPAADAQTEPATEAEEVETEAPAEPETEAEPATKAPSEPGTEAPAPSVTEAPAVSATEAPTAAEVSAPRRGDVQAGTSKSTAGAIKLGEKVEGTFPLDSGTVNDYYKMTLSESGTVSIQGASDAGKVTIKLLNSKGTSIWSKANVDLKTATVLDLTAGTYYLIISKPGTDYGDYHFTASFTSAKETLAEKDGALCNTSDKASKMSTGTRIVGHFSITDDVDWFTFTLAKPGRLRFVSTTAMEAVDFELTDAKGNVIFSETSEEHTNNPNKLDRSMDVTAGTYYLCVNQVYDTGTYIFQINHTGVSETFADAPGGSNNSFATANVLSANTTYTGQLAENDAADFFKFTISDSKASIRLTASTSLTKASYSLYNSSKTLLKPFETGSENASTPGQLDESVPLAKGTYYLKVSSTGNYTGSYSFQLKTSAIFVPVITSMTNGNGTITIRWNSNGTDRTRVFVKKSGKWTAVGDSTTTSFVYKKPVAGASYTFTIRSVSKDGKTYVSGYDSAGATIKYIAPPVITNLTPVAAGMKVTWKAQTGAVRYKCFYREPKGTWTYGGTTTGTTLTVKKLKNNIKYDFTVRAVTANGKSYTSGYLNPGKTALFLDAPKITRATPLLNSVQVEWEKREGASKYRVFYKTGSSKWTKAGDTDKTSFAIQGLTKGKTYNVTVRCLSKDGKLYESGFESPGKSVQYLAAPVISSVSQDASGVKVKWNAITGAAKYRVYVQEGGKGDYKTVATVTTNNCLVTTLKAKTKYVFVVRCVSADGKSYTSGYYAAGKTFTTK